MNHFRFVGIYAGLAMLMLMIMPSSIVADELEIKVEGDKKAIVYVNETDKVSTLKEKIVEELKKNNKEEKNIFMKENWDMNKYKKAKMEETNYENNEIRTSRITLRHDKDGSPFEDGKTMKECSIESEKYGNYAYVYLTLDELEIKVEGDKNAIVYVKETDKVSMMKQKIVEKLRENIYKEIEILKAKLEEKKNEKNKILTARITLRSDENGIPFKDGKTMNEFVLVKNCATVSLALEGFEIFVHYKGKTYTVWVNDTDTVYQLNKSIEKVTRVSSSQQKLAFPTHNDVLNDATKTMHSYNIGKGASLSLWREFQIGCQYKLNEYFPIVEETEKVSSVKEKVKVKRQIREKSDILLNNIKLFYLGKELKNDAEIGSYYGIDLSRSARVCVQHSPFSK